MGGLRQSASASPGFAAFALGFRPFFLAAGIAAVLLMSAWLLVLRGDLGTGIWPAPLWHGHEMLFGFTVAVIAGFLLTAAQNWTGLATPSGAPLAGLFLLWLAGRAAFLAPGLPPLATALIDLAFLPVLALVLAAPIVRAKQSNNLVFPLLLLTLAGANALLHAEAIGVADTGSLGLNLALFAVVIMITVIAGRIVPSFTDNRLGTRVRYSKGVEALALSITPVALVAVLVSPDSSLSVLLAALAALVHAVRLAGWYTSKFWAVPLLWILHVGYAWIPLGFVLLALGSSGWVPSVSPAVHAFAAGGIGVLTLGMMARVSLGHTGRLLEAPPVMRWAFLAINFSALLRVAVPLVRPDATLLGIHGGGAFWIAAFGLFIVVYAPVLLRPRVDGKPG